MQLPPSLASHPDAPLLHWAIDWATQHRLSPSAPPPQITPLTHGGSARRYYRLAWPTSPSFSLIASAYDPTERPENALFAPIASFLRDTLHLPVPQIYARHPSAPHLLIEDLGPLDLYAHRHAPSDFLLATYRQTLTAILPLYRDGLTAASHAALPLNPPFDRALYDWEHRYFLTHTVHQWAALPPLPPHQSAALQAEFDRLAALLLAAPPTLVHRDLQSQNILLTPTGPAFIDFQGLRRGTAYYDLASLLFDPYMRLAAPLRDRLIADSFALLPPSCRAPDAAAHTCLLLAAAVQRLLQALGAYANLALNRGKPHFLAHLPTALTLLEEILQTEPLTSSLPLPTLRDLVHQLRGNLSP
ncbi:MAG: phosphotransferase [Verrucomicrobiae bacterium]|nr:phosphotransferase [Verrucomicrobiae bacterium]